MTYTSHGHYIPGTQVSALPPRQVARCGGPGMCVVCSREAAGEKVAEVDHGPDTLQKVTRALTIGGFAPDVVEDIIRILHNENIVFREVETRE